MDNAKPHVERIMTASYCERRQTLSVFHPQWGEIARWILIRSYVQDYFPGALQSPGPHIFPTELYRLIKNNGADLRHDYGLLCFCKPIDSKISAMLLQAYRQERRVLIIEATQQDGGSLYCTTPMFLQAGPDRSPRLSEEIEARDGLLLPEKILHVVFSD